MAEQTYLIIGNGVAGISALQEIRQHDRAGRILLVSDEGSDYYYRASLSEWLSGDLTDETLMGRTPAFYDALRIERVTGHVRRIDSAERQAALDSGRSLSYDHLLIATGARANVYPVEGLDETLVLRTLADARRIKQRLQACSRALIVGGGVLGLELAGALHALDVPHIAIVQRSAPLGTPLLDRGAAAWLRKRMAADGVDLFIGDTVSHVVSHGAGRTAHLTSGRTWRFDLLVQAVGITPTFPELPGLKTGSGIRIDARCRTNLPAIYAAGDCTERRHPGGDTWRTTRIWPDCAEQGRIAGRNMVGQAARLPAQPSFSASLLYTVPYTYTGEPHGRGEAEATSSEEEMELVWQTESGYRKVRVLDGRLAGALLLGERHGGPALAQAIGRPVAAYGDAIARPDFAWNERTGQDWDYELF